jgi:GGDEF domain-containing protein
MSTGEYFAVCYADLDNFKEFNDRYGYNSGDSVIFLTSRILRDVVRSLAPEGFVGHIGGDDFIFDVPLDKLEVCCDEIIQLFDELIPYQYTVEDRRAGYFLGKDRRGTVHRIPLMTLSIGVVTNYFENFSHTAQVSELAAEMKNYAKTLPGSLYVVDRRGLTGAPSADSPQNRAMDSKVTQGRDG